MNAMRIDLSNFTRRLVQDAFSEGIPATWERRAQALENALSRPGDFVGLATPEEIAERDARLRTAAAACRHRALLYEKGDDISPDVEAVLAEVGV